jgi:4a-hydroxytetrahydrobiopterin dehydratase
VRAKLSKSDIETHLKTCPGWQLAQDGLSIGRNLVFTTFAEAFGFMMEAAIIAEKFDHHPEWTNVWRKVSVTLTTHSAKGLTELDFALARAMNEIAKKRLVLP